MTANARKLAAALRSGKYQQGRGRLRTKSGFCCLGVACDLYRQETGNGDWEPNGSEGFNFVWSGTRVRESYYLPEPVRAWLGFRDVLGAWSSDTLSALNDGGRSFATIADRIESEEGLYEAEGTE